MKKNKKIFLLSMLLGVAFIMIITMVFVSNLNATAKRKSSKEEKVVKIIKPPKVLKKVYPVYPKEAKKDKIQGIVVLECLTDTKGNVQSVKVLKGEHALTQAAVNAAKQWVFEPIIINGTPTPVKFTLTMNFSLDEGQGKNIQEKSKIKLTKSTNIVKNKPPKVLKKVYPVYPEEAKKERIQGIVVLECLTDTKGNVQRVKVLRGHPALTQAAVDAVKQWVFEPTSKTEKFTLTIKFNFNGEKDKKNKIVK